MSGEPRALAAGCWLLAAGCRLLWSTSSFSGFLFAAHPATRAVFTGNWSRRPGVCWRLGQQVHVFPRFFLPAALSKIEACLGATGAHSF